MLAHFSTRVLMLVAVALLITGCASEPTARSLKRCPDGHTTLKNVPVLYGLVDPKGKGPAAEKLRQDVENLKVALGGGVRFPGSPKHRVICTQCRFTHSAISDEIVKASWWFRSSADLDSFSIAFSEWVRLFPVPARLELTEPVQYSQTLNEAWQLTDEGIGYETKLAAETLKNRIDAWLKQNRIDCTFSAEQMPSPFNGATLEIFKWGAREPSVLVILRYDHADLSSWVMASFAKRP